MITPTGVKDASDSTSGAANAEMRQPYSGQLNKFTNVMKGWQYRHFVLDPEKGIIEYFLPEEKFGKARGCQYLAGAIVLPSDEDSQTFNINFASGAAFKLRAANVKDRQVWVDRIRAVAQMHDNAIAQNNPPLAGRDLHPVMPPTPLGSRSHISNGEPSEELQHLSLSILDAFGSVHDIIHQSELKVNDLCNAIENLPSSGSPKCVDEDLLLLKASAQASLLSLEQGLTILQDYRELNQGPLAPLHTNHYHISKSVFAALPSPKRNPSSTVNKAGNSNLSKVTNMGQNFSSSTHSLPAELKASHQNKDT